MALLFSSLARAMWGSSGSTAAGRGVQGRVAWVPNLGGKCHAPSTPHALHGLPNPIPNPRTWQDLRWLAPAQLFDHEVGCGQACDPGALLGEAVGSVVESLYPVARHEQVAEAGRLVGAPLGRAWQQQATAEGRQTPGLDN